jgi:hypothetical protein
MKRVSVALSRPEAFVNSSLHISCTTRARSTVSLVLTVSEMLSRIRVVAQFGLRSVTRDGIRGQRSRSRSGVCHGVHPILDTHEPPADRIVNLSTPPARAFIQERERIIPQQLEALRELPTPVLRVHERRQLAEQCCGASSRICKVAVMEITCVPAHRLGHREPAGANRRSRTPARRDVIVTALARTQRRSSCSPWT